MREHKFDLRPPSSHPGTLAHLLDATIRRQGEKKKYSPSILSEEQEIDAQINKDLSGSGGPDSPVASGVNELNKDLLDTLPPKPPPKLPPKPPAMMQETSQDSYWKPPPPLPDIQNAPPRPPPPRKEPLVTPMPISPPVKETLNNKDNDENAPPIPPKTNSPSSNECSISNQAPPLPPPPIRTADSPVVPPPIIPRISNLHNTGFSQTNDGIDNNRIAEEKEVVPPIVPPRPSSSLPTKGTLPSNVPHQRVTSKPAPPIPPKPIR